MMRKNGFTLLEVMISIFIFGIGMLVYMNFQARSSALMFDTETTIVASMLANEFAEAVSSLSDVSDGVIPSEFQKFTDSDSGSTLTCKTWYLDSEAKTAYGNNLAIISGPFDGRGKQVATGSNGFFYRFIRISTYNADVNGGNCDFTDSTSYGVLRVVKIMVRWPLKDHSEAVCSAVDTANCDQIEVTLVKSII